MVKNIIGQRFGKLIVLENTGKRKRGHVVWLCQCDCGNITEAIGTNLIIGQTQSCGCLAKEILVKRNKKRAGKGTGKRKSRPRLYRIWQSMRGRCFNPNDKNHDRYRARGITVCSEWKDSYQTFKDWALFHDYSNNLTIDRIDNDGNYEPSNCQWITNIENIAKKKRSANRDYASFLIGDSIGKIATSK